MQFANLQSAQAALEGIATAAHSAAQALAEVSEADAFADLLPDATEGRPPLFDAMLSAVGSIDFGALIGGFLVGPGAALSQTLKDGLTADAAECDAHKQAFSNMGQRARDAMAAL